MKDILSMLEDSYKSNRIGELQGTIRSIFRDYFVNKGYLEHLPAPLISKDDKTVVFTGSSTNVVKPVIISGNYPNAKGFLVIQECLRNHALKYAFDNNWLPFGQAYFNISSILSKPGRFSEVVLEALDFLTINLSIDSSKVVIKSTKKLSELKDIKDYTSFNVEFDTKDDKYYKWVYGIPEIRGEGVTISIKNKLKDFSLDIGNIIRILDKDGNERGTEFGYGHEFLLSTILGIENPLALSQVFEMFPFYPDLTSKYYGCLEAIARIKNAGVKQRNHGAGSIYRKYLRSFQYIGHTIGKDIKNMISEISRYCEHLSSSKDLSLEHRLLDKYANWDNSKISPIIKNPNKQ